MSHTFFDNFSAEKNLICWGISNSSSEETGHLSRSCCKEIPKQTVMVLPDLLLFCSVYSLNTNTSNRSDLADWLLPAAYLQPQSLGHHPYVNADKHHSPGVVGLSHDEGSAVEACEKSSTHLVGIGIAHLEEKSSIRQNMGCVRLHIFL